MPFQFRKEAIEEELNSTFPSQGQGNPPLYYSLSEVVVPTYSINEVSSGTTLAENLQTAWDFSTGHQQIVNQTVTAINNPGFYKVDATFTNGGQAADTTTFTITDGLTSKIVFQQYFDPGTDFSITDTPYIIFLRSGDSFVVSNTSGVCNVWYRQIATVNGTLVNPLGFSAA
tara:strand:+ start:1355 stop:1870 length:516 start_codon:yes stop_codon:yes gene_type:complete